MDELTQDLLDLASEYGIATEYTGWRGEEVQVSARTITAVLGAMDVDASSPEAAGAALAERRVARWRALLPPCVVVQQGKPASFPVHVADSGEAEVWLELETGEGRRELRPRGGEPDRREVDGRPVVQRSFEVPPDVPLGYHRLYARAGAQEAATTLIVTPAFLGLPQSLGARRTWGFATQLYSVRSRGSWGVGDLADLTDVAVWSGAELGAGYVLVNPLHAAEPVAPMEPSPYLPSSRRFFNPLYLRVERIAEYADLGAEARRTVDAARADVRDRLSGVDRIDRDTSWTAKQEALRLVHAVPRSEGRERDLRAFRAREGTALEDFATWCAIAQAHGNSFHDWPQELRDPASPAVAAFREEHRDEVDFQVWLQWVLDEQLLAAQGKATGAGMELGIMHDLAVGVHPGGADAWRMADTYATHVQVGAPPDAFNQRGQDWSQPPWRPDRLEELGYEPLRDLIATVLRHAGGVRVDHIIGFFRLWWIPTGGPPSEGTYVRYDHDAMIGVLALEAHRAGAVVVGEDLGVVEPSARDYLRSRGVLGTSILWFERDDHGRPLPAEKWREYCMASVTTHDLPPTAGYLTGEHVRLRDRLGLLTRSVEEEVSADEGERESWLEEVRRRGLLSRSADDVAETVTALHRYLTLSPARLLGISMADAVGDPRTQNQPGTSDEYPNWRVPLSGPDRTPMLLEDVMSSDRAAALVEAVRAAGGFAR